ncbi:MAG: hypothetical protein IJI10_02570 [Eubacterium sp.]|nr:hypothetical protein [Eubacterium sp.]
MKKQSTIITKYRKWILAGFCAFGLLAAGCSGEIPRDQGAGASSSSASLLSEGLQASGSEAASAAEGAGTDAGSTAEPAEGADAEAGSEAGLQKDAGGESTGTLQTGMDAAGQQYRWPVFDELGITAEYLCGLRYDSGVRCDVFRVSSAAEDNLIFEINDIHLNDDICTDANVFVSTEPGSAADSQSDSLTQSILLMERDGIALESISGMAQVYSWEQDENGNQKLLTEEPFKVSFPEDYAPELICEPAYDMLAEAQVLRDEGGIKISLVGCGGYYGASDGISGILCIENDSQETIPYHISAAEVNGRTVELYSDGSGSGSLPAGALRYFDFRIGESELEEAGITSAAEMKLQVLTDTEQNTGVMMRSAGGNWYPVKLTQHGELSDVFAPGEVIYEDDWIQLGYIGTRIDWYPEDEYQEEAHGYCNWDLAVVNKTDENIELRMEDAVVNGVPADESEAKPYFRSDEIGAHAKRNLSAFLRIQENQVPEISFRIQVRKQGGGALLNYAEDVVTITPDEMQ